MVPSTVCFIYRRKQQKKQKSKINRSAGSLIVFTNCQANRTDLQRSIKQRSEWMIESNCRSGRLRSCIVLTFHLLHGIQSIGIRDRWPGVCDDIGLSTEVGTVVVVVGLWIGDHRCRRAVRETDRGLSVSVGIQSVATLAVHRCVMHVTGFYSPFRGNWFKFNYSRDVYKVIFIIPRSVERNPLQVLWHFHW